MKVCFLHVRQNRSCAEKMIASVREHMPFATIVHLADENEPEFPGCEVRRKRWNGKFIAEWWIGHLADLPEGEWLSLDTDVIVQYDLGKVFAFPFDVAVTQRDGPIWDKAGTDLTQHMPYNGGVIWWRNPRFWRDCHVWISAQDEKIRGWYGHQLAIALKARKYRTLKLHCDNWNYTPSSEDEDVGDRFAVHYKGSRKEWMLRR